MADTNELKPCPFCGGQGVASDRTCDKDTSYNPNDRAYPVVRCSKCFTTVGGKDWSSVSTAIEAWNKRATATSPVDAALADVLKVVECQLGHAADVSATYVAFTRDETMQIRAALRARAVPEGFTLVENAALSMALAHATTTHGELYREAYEKLLSASKAGDGGAG